MGTIGGIRALGSILGSNNKTVESRVKSGDRGRAEEKVLAESGRTETPIEDVPPLVMSSAPYSTRGVSILLPIIATIGKAET